MENNLKVKWEDEEMQKMWDKPMKPGPIISKPPVPFKFNVRDEVYITHYKKNGMITHREYHDNGRHQWDQYAVRVIHDDGSTDAYEIEASWLEMGHKPVID